MRLCFFVFLVHMQSSSIPFCFLLQSKQCLPSSSAFWSVPPGLLGSQTLLLVEHFFLFLLLPLLLLTRPSGWFEVQLAALCLHYQGFHLLAISLTLLFFFLHAFWRNHQYTWLGGSLALPAFPSYMQLCPS